MKKQSAIAHDLPGMLPHLFEHKKLSVEEKHRREKGNWHSSADGPYDAANKLKSLVDLIWEFCLLHSDQANPEPLSPDDDRYNRAVQAEIALLHICHLQKYMNSGLPCESVIAAITVGYHYGTTKMLEFETSVKRDQAAARVRSQIAKQKQQVAQNRKLQAVAEMVRRLRMNPKMRPKSVAQDMAKETTVDGDGNTVPRWTIKPGKAISARTLESYYTESKRSSEK